MNHESRCTGPLPPGEALEDGEVADDVLARWEARTVDLRATAPETT